jgi:predicted short-subunit dehydrogenase-like oxidoreductase (DUF2520 family)
VSSASARRAVFVFGAGKVGAGLARAIRRAGYAVTLRAQRRGLPARRIDADIVLLAVRDRDVPQVAEALRRGGLLGHRPAIVAHCAGALGPEALTAVRSPAVAVAQMHPMISFATPEATPDLARGQLLVMGDARALRALGALGRRLGMTPRQLPGLDRVAYHAAAGLVANGAAALAAGGQALLAAAGVDPKTAAAMLGPLLRSVAENVERLGLPEALTGPVRRGDAAGVEKHLAVLAKLAPELAPLYVASARVQLPLARALGDGEASGFQAIERVLEGASFPRAVAPVRPLRDPSHGPRRRPVPLAAGRDG